MLSCGNDTKFKDKLWPCPLILWPQNPRSFSGRGQYICVVSLLYAKRKWSCCVETVKRLKSKFDLWPFDPKSTEVLLRSMQTYMWSIIIVCQMEEELWYRNHFFTDGQTDGQTCIQRDRQTAVVKTEYLHNFVGGGMQTYFQCGEIVEKLPLEVKISWGSNFFTTFGSKFNVKIWPVSTFNVEKWHGESFLTLKNDPGSHFSTGSLFDVTPALFSRK